MHFRLDWGYIDPGGGTCKAISHNTERTRVFFVDVRNRTFLDLPDPAVSPFETNDIPTISHDIPRFPNDAPKTNP